jgi:hypothetical protein
MDAGCNPVVKGVLNGVIAQLYENADLRTRMFIDVQLRDHARRAVGLALHEAQRTSSRYERHARIRFSHVGEIAAFPAFANALARMVKEESEGRVSCVVYTRHPNASDLNPGLFVINFTLDPVSEERIAWAPRNSRIVYSAFGGTVSSKAEINFLEHHRWSHVLPEGRGPICPATAPDVAERTCDAVRCDKCFTQPSMTVPLSREYRSNGMPK